MPSATTETINADFRSWLQKQFTDRCRKNARFSLRSFARMLDTDPSTVSQILAGKRKVSQKSINKICDRLSAAPTERRRFLPAKGAEGATADAAYHQLTADAFAVMADWYHYAILELTYVKGFQSHPRWIGAKLGLSPTEAAIAVERLERLELLERVGGRLVKTNAFLTNFADGATAPALRELQRQLLRRALEAIDFVPPEDKDITSITMAVNPERIPEARKKIKKFRRELCDFLTAGEQTQVFNLGVQLYPISHLQSLKGESTNA